MRKHASTILLKLSTLVQMMLWAILITQADHLCTEPCISHVSFLPMMFAIRMLAIISGLFSVSSPELDTGILLDEIHNGQDGFFFLSVRELNGGVRERDGGGRGATMQQRAIE